MKNLLHEIRSCDVCAAHLPLGANPVLAAHRSEMSVVLIPEENAKELRDVPSSVQRSLEIVPVKHMDEVLRLALRLEERQESFLSETSRILDWRLAQEGSGAPSTH